MKLHCLMALPALASGGSSDPSNLTGAAPSGEMKAATGAHSAFAWPFFAIVVTVLLCFCVLDTFLFEIVGQGLALEYATMYA